jgi:hypothetical protein
LEEVREEVVAEEEVELIAEQCRQADPDRGEKRCRRCRKVASHPVVHPWSRNVVSMNFLQIGRKAPGKLPDRGTGRDRGRWT